MPCPSPIATCKWQHAAATPTKNKTKGSRLKPLLQNGPLCDTAAMLPFSLPAVVFYGLATLGCNPRVRDALGQRIPAGVGLVLALLAVACHASVHVLAWDRLGGPDLHFFAALSWVALGMAAISLTLAWRRQAALVGLVVFPIALLCVLAYGLYGTGPEQAIAWQLQLHAFIALLAFATLAIAAVLALMLWVQERALRRHIPRSPGRSLLPPLTELESLLFRTITVGFVLLTATLLTGLLFVENLFTQHLVHKTVLSVLSWLLFGGLLLGRWRYGWRGPVAVRWTLAAMALLMLAFFGSRFVLELVLHRPV